MVHAFELRMGNRLWHYASAEAEPVMITVAGLMAKDGAMYIQSDGAQAIELGKGKVKPIPLSDEILETCGFQKDEIEYIGNLWHLHPVQILDDNGLWLVNDKLRKRLKLHCLHQLQNLFFALTAKELEISSPHF